MNRDDSLKILNSVYEDIKNMTEEDIENFNNTIREYDKEQKMTDREVKEHLIFNPETGISEDGTMHDCVYRPRINQLKIEDSCKFGKDYIKIVFKNGSTLDTLVMEEKMTREEAIKVLKKKMYEDADKITFEHLDGSQCMRTINIDLEMKEAIEVLEQPMTLAEFLGWQEGAEYEYEATGIVKVGNNILYEKNEKCSSGWCNFPLFTDEIEDLRQAKKVELKPKAWIVRDEYSYKCLIMELEEQGYTKAPHSRGYSPVFPIIYINYDGEYSEAQFGSTIAKTYNIVDYHKEPPKFYAKIKGWELTNDTDCYWHKDENPIHGIYPWSREEASIYTKEEWAELKITKENADFEMIK